MVPVDQLSHETRRRIAVEVFGAFFVDTAIAAVLYRIPALDSWFHVAVAGLFLYLPVWLLRHRDLGSYGLRARPVGRNILFAVVVALILFPPFFAGFAIWERVACAIGPLRPLAPVACRPGSLFAHVALRL